MQVANRRLGGVPKPLRRNGHSWSPSERRYAFGRGAGVSGEPQHWALDEKQCLPVRVVAGSRMTVACDAYTAEKLLAGVTAMVSLAKAVAVDTG